MDRTVPVESGETRWRSGRRRPFRYPYPGWPTRPTPGSNGPGEVPGPDQLLIGLISVLAGGWAIVLLVVSNPVSVKMTV